LQLLGNVDFGIASKLADLFNLLLQFHQRLLELE
jgi:hypothetical protein